MKFQGVEITTRETYLDLLQQIADEGWKVRKDEDYMAYTAKAGEDTSANTATTTLTLAFGQIQYGYILQAMAEVYKYGRGQKYADMAVELIGRIVKIYDWVMANCSISEYDFDSLQLVDSGFAGGPFIKACMILREAGELSDGLYNSLQPVLESAVRSSLRLPEWGPFNRCALKFTILDRFARFYPQSAYAADAEKLSRFLAHDSIGRWHMEDTPLYNGIWYACIAEYLHENNIRNFRTDTIMHYYASYTTHIQTPEGSLPDYGDARTREFGCAALAVGFLEWAAVLFNDGEVKYCVSKFIEYNRGYQKTIAEAWVVRSLSLAAEMAGTAVEPKYPAYSSGEVIEDLVGKKIVFRGENSDYLMLNYRDEGNYALPARQNMFCTIPAPAEKVHHGHADENAITSLIYKNKFLLADGGYRDSIVADGHYRADFYHNRIVLRNGRMFKEKGFLEYAENLGAYLKVETQKIFYHELAGLEVSRTRLEDPHHSATQDRTICHFGEGIYLVIDTVRAHKVYEYTAGAMWYGGDIVKNDTGDYIVKQTLPQFMGGRDTDGLNLRVVFARKDLAESVETIRRNHDDSQKALTQYFSEYLGRDEFLHFVTLLMPEDADTKSGNDAMAKSLSCEQTACGHGLKVEVTVSGKKYTICTKMDETYGFNNHQKRPTYSFEQGRISYGDFTTDALLAVFTEETGAAAIDYSAIMTSRVDYKASTVWSSMKVGFANNDLTYNSGAINWPRWEGSFSK